MLLLPNCEVRTAKFLDCSFNIWMNEMRSIQKPEVPILSVWNKQLVNKNFIVKLLQTCLRVFRKLSDNFRKTYEVLFKAHFCEN